MTNTSQTPATTVKRPRFYYGWVIVVISSIANFVSFGAGNNSLGVFLRPMSESLGWSRTLFTGAATVQSIGNLIISPIVGPLVDRYDPRFVLLTASGIACICYNFMGSISEVWQFYFLYTAATALGLNELGAQVTNAIVAKWFVRMRGRALAMISIANNIGAIVIIPLVAWLVESQGWHAAWGTLGAIVIVMLLPPIAIFMRRRPEDIGLRPDGDPLEGAASRQTNAESALPKPRREEPQWGVRDALRTRTAWLLVISGNMYSLAAGGMIVHQVPYLTDVGFSLQTASLVVSLNHITAIFTKTVAGVMAERYPIRYCLTVCYLARIVSILTLVLGEGPLRLLGFAIFSGIGQSSAPLSATIWPDYYGRASIGAIRGVLQPFNIFSSLGGPLFAAIVFDMTGTYEGAFFAYSASLFLAAVSGWFATPPGPAPVRSTVAATESVL